MGTRLLLKRLILIQIKIKRDQTIQTTQTSQKHTQITTLNDPAHWSGETLRVIIRGVKINLIY